MPEIYKNKIRCKKCKDVIESTHRHDMKYCKCGAVFIDGGKDYFRMGGDKDQIEDVSEYIIPKSEYDHLQMRDHMLMCLEAGGVDNWEWYSESLREFNELYHKET